MAIRASRTDGLLVLVAVLLAAVWFLFPNDSADERLSMVDWSDTATAAPTELFVERGNAHVTLRRSNDPSTHYEVASRSGIVADPAAVDRLLHALAHLEVVRLVDAAWPKGATNATAVAIELATVAGKRKLTLGPMAASPPGARYATFTRGKHQQVVVLAAASARALDMEPDALLDHRVLDWLPSELRRLDITDGAARFVIERQDNGRWVLVDSLRARVRRRTMERLLLGLTELAVTKFVELSAASTAVRAGPSRLFAIEASRDGQIVRAQLRIGGRCPDDPQAHAVTLEGNRTMAGCVGAEALSKLELDRPELLDDAAFSFHADEVERLRVTGLGPAWKLTRKDSAFELEIEKPSSVGLSAGNGLLERLVAIRGVPAGPCAFSQQRTGPLVSLRSFVVGDDGPTVETVQWAAPGAALRICRDDGVELVLTAQAAQMLEVEPTLLRDPVLLDTAIENITEIKLETPAGRQTLRLDGQGNLSLTGPQPAPPDASAIESLREQLARLRTTAWLPIPALANQRYSPNARVDITVNQEIHAENPDPVAAGSARSVAPTSVKSAIGPGVAADATAPTRHRLQLLLEESQTAVGFWDADPAAFQLAPSLVELLDGLLLDRSLLRLTDADRTLSLSRGPNQIRLKSKNGSWGLESGAMEASVLARVIVELENLRALSVYASRSLPTNLLKNEPNGTALRIEYAADASGDQQPRVRFDVGPRFERRGIWVRRATLTRPSLTMLLRDEALKTTLELLREPG